MRYRVLLPVLTLPLLVGCDPGNDKVANEAAVEADTEAYEASSDAYDAATMDAASDVAAAAEEAADAAQADGMSVEASGDDGISEPPPEGPPL